MVIVLYFLSCLLNYCNMNVTYDIDLALMKIARETGEEEYESIHILKEKYGISINSEEITRFINNPKDSQIQHLEIFDELKEIHCIDLELISESDWELIMDSRYWKNAYIQVTREIIANNILTNLLK